MTTDRWTSAFPQAPQYRPGDGMQTDAGQSGMSLRDWFAGQFLAGRASDLWDDPTRDALARESYMVADAMMAERAKP